ncbi:HTH-type transcriptional repressor AcnR [Planctomycetes bacterium Pla163]|uniref:HTH-type transcriptional repressor AcnR n=1 Tax=Rohdeia mirabilis TaxID=2528008 RepID=A0A518CYF6_9BACT|nr:HTH-type transcriptional repressor AcnR [Planctomycetes bacterium Pla163]
MHDFSEPHTPTEAPATGLDPSAQPGAVERGAATRQALLDTAERLFAEHGYGATSLRRITAAADANLAAVHYHFGSKQDLFVALFRRRVEPVNRQRVERLERLIAASAPQAPPLEDVLDVLVRPMLALRDEPGGEHFVRLVGRLFAEPGDHLTALREEFDEVRSKFLPVLAAQLPHLDREQLALRMQFTIGSLANVLAQAHRSNGPTCFPPFTTTPERVADELVAYAAAGLRAPVRRTPPDAPAAPNDTEPLQ